MSEYAESADEVDDGAAFDDELVPSEETAEGKRSSMWMLIALAVLALLLIWIILGVWRYLQVLGYGGF
jgi:predicted nucleic acid-binding Zn ribbon protein